MKILIYVVVFFIYSALEPFMSNASYAIATTLAYDADTVGLICGALAAARAVFAYCCARWLCKHRHQRQAEKAALAASESPTPVPPPAESEPTIADLASPAPATPKLRYCKHCGSPIDPTTRQCTGCGKQYFRPPVLHKKHLCIGAGVLVCAAVVVLSVNLVSQKNVALSQVEELTAQISEMENTVAEKEQQIRLLQRDKEMYQSKLTQKSEAFDELRKENTMYREHLRYCEDYCAYIVPTSISGINSDGQYHRLNCPYAGKIDNLVMIEIGFLESRGYKPCSHC